MLSGCSRELDTPGERLRILGRALPEAFVGVQFDAPIATAGGLRPFRYELASGELPEGIALAAGVLTGVPTTVGTYTFTIEVSDGNLASTVREFRLVVEDVPPPELRLDVPPTEIRGPSTIRVSVDGNSVQGLRTVLRWNPDVLRLVPGSVRSESASIAVFFDAREGELQLDVGILGTARSGATGLARFELEPVSASSSGPATAVDVGLEARTEFRALAGHAYAEDAFGATLDAPTEAPASDDGANVAPSGTDLARTRPVALAGGAA